MAYIGNIPAEAYSAFQKQDFTTSATTSYTLDHPVSNQNELALFINFVRQEPTAAYTASGTSLTLTSATSVGDDMYCVYLGKAVQTVNPPSGSVGSSQISADLITGQTALGATPADTDELLISDAGTLKRVDYSYLKSANTPAFSAYRGSSQSISNEAYNKISFDYEFYDTDNAYDTTTNYRFTVPSGKAGKYHFDAMVRFSAFTGEVRLVSYKNGGDYGFQSTYIGNITTTVTSSFDLDLSAGDYIEIYCWQNSGGSLNLSADTTDPILTTFSGFKITE